MTQWSRWAKQPEVIGLRVLQPVSVSISHLCCQTFERRQRRTEKTAGRIPSRVDSRYSAVCGHEPGHYPVPERMENNRLLDIKVQQGLVNRENHAADVTEILLCPRSLVSICPNAKQTQCCVCGSRPFDYFGQVKRLMKGKENSPSWQSSLRLAVMCILGFAFITFYQLDMMKSPKVQNKLCMKWV